jgi:cystathionine beta-lyase/cystathionine gamma-synthase
MTQTLSKIRQQAEIAFSHEQSQFFARGHAVEEMDAFVLARDAKTTRLREARLAKQAQDIQKASAGLIEKRASKA